MKLLFFALHWGYLRHYRSALKTLAERGHRIHLAVDKQDKIGSIRMIEDLVARHPGITYGETPDRTRDVWLDVGTWLRLGLDYLRYLEPGYDPYPKLRARSRERTPWLIRLWTLIPGLGSAAGRRLLSSCLKAMERDIPIDRKTRKFIEEHDPDVVLITPLLGLGTSQFDQLRCAKVMGRRTCLCVGSWDHLSSKALIRFTPDLLTVWNETQKAEAVGMHGVAPDAVAITGAQGWDQWFGRRPATDAESFKQRLGLDPERPFVLWLCSTPFPGSIPESRYVLRWLRDLRASADPSLEHVGVLIRPHPQRMPEWEEADLSEFDNVALWGDNPVTLDARNAYFDSMFHCVAAVGINTSAMIEAGILGRPVHTILPPEYHTSQAETVHFHYLTQVGGGLLHVARDFDEHRGQLLQAIAREGTADARSRAFTEAFVRPHGLEVAATPRFVEAVEGLAHAEVRADEPGLPVRVLQLVLLPVLAGAWVAARLFGFILGSPMTVHRGKKKIRAAFLLGVSLLQRVWKLARKGGRVGLKGARMAAYRTGKRGRAVLRAVSRVLMRAWRRLRLLLHRGAKKVRAAGRLAIAVVGGNKPARFDDDG